MKAKLLVSTAFLAASVSLSAQKVLPSLYMPTKAKKLSKGNLRSICRTPGFMYLRWSLGRRKFGYS